MYKYLKNNLWNNHHFSIRAKCQVYRAIVLVVLLYDAKAWTIWWANVQNASVNDATFKT